MELHPIQCETLVELGSFNQLGNCNIMIIPNNLWLFNYLFLAASCLLLDTCMSVYHYIVLILIFCFLRNHDCVTDEVRNIFI